MPGSPGFLMLVKLYVVIIYIAMNRIAERRALYYQDDPDYDPFIGVDVNEYLIETFPQLTLKQRRAVWNLCQVDGDFNFDPVYAEIDAWVDAVLNPS